MLRQLRYAVLLLLLLVIVGPGGCSDSPGTVHGTVTLDGQPLKEGEVRFVPADGQSQTASAKITEGEFTATVPLGEMIVQISAPKIVGTHKMYDTPDSPVVNDTEDRIPKRYNIQSELKITVKKGNQDETFALTSQ